MILGVTRSFLELLLIPARKKGAKAQLEQVRLHLVDAVLELAARTRTAVVKVRDGITGYEDPGWYEHPPGTVAYGL